MINTLPATSRAGGDGPRQRSVGRGALLERLLADGFAALPAAGKEGRKKGAAKPSKAVPEARASTTEDAMPKSPVAFWR